ncbi:MAG TPA: helix-turn-helix domain-containing protein [Desulfosporosinus sp.]|nr:helix-turn-helix domain-containing protein [Desulfosporosinus sp.]
MGNTVLKINRANASEIKNLIAENESYTVGARLHVVYLVAMGHSSRKLSEIHNISFKQITNWVHRFENEGIEGLKDRKGRGRHSALSEADLLKIKLLITTEKPSKYGFETEKWTGPMVKQWIQKEYGVEYQKAQIYNLLSKIGICFEKKHGLISSESLV